MIISTGTQEAKRGLTFRTITGSIPVTSDGASAVTTVGRSIRRPEGHDVLRAIGESDGQLAENASIHGRGFESHPVVSKFKH